MRSVQVHRVIIEHVFWRGLYFFSVFLLNIVISRNLGADGSGWMFYIINNLSFSLLITSLSLESGAGYYGSTGEINPQKIAVFCVFWSAVATTLNFFILPWLSPSSYPFFISSPQFVPACIIYILGVLLTTYFMALFFAKKIFILPNLLLLTVNMGLMLLLFLFAKDPFLSRHFMILFFSSFLLQGVLLAVIYLMDGACSKDWGLPSWTEMRKLFHFSFLALAGNIIFFLVYRVDFWFVKAFCSYSDLGNYIQVSKLGQLLIVLPSIIASTIFPLVAGGRRQEVNYAMQVMTRSLLMLVGVFCLLIAITGEWLFPFLFGNSFSAMPVLFLLLIPGILSLTAHYPLSAYYAGKKMLGVNIRGCLLSLAIIVTGDIFFIPKWGVRAAAIISSLGYASYCTYVLLVFKREYGTSLLGFFIPEKSDFMWIRKIIRIKT